MEKSEIKLRRATLNDVDNILEIEKSAAKIKTYSALTNKDEIRKEVDKTFFYFIVRQNKLLGDVSYEIKNENHAYISGLVVLPKFQGQGIARQAMEIILEKLKDVKLIDLVTHPENEKAIGLYKSLGFKQTGEPIENYFGDGEPRIRMALEKL